MLKLIKVSLVTLIALIVLAAVPWLPGPQVDDMRGVETIVPLNVRDPSALVMGPLFIYRAQKNSR